MKLRRLWILLSGAALLVGGLVVGVTNPAAGQTSGCAGDVVVALGVQVLDRPGENVYEIPLPSALGPGVWSVEVASHDRSEDRVTQMQSSERWTLSVWGHVTLGPTRDLPDGVTETSTVDALGTFVSTGGASGVTVRHALAPVPGGTESVTAVCAGFTLVEGPGQGIAATPHVDCGLGEIDVSVANHGRVGGSFDATIGETRVEGHVAPGATQVVRAEITAASTRVVVHAEGAAVLDTTLDTTCTPEPPPTTPTTTAAPPSVPPVDPPTAVPAPTPAAPPSPTPRPAAGDVAPPLGTPDTTPRIRAADIAASTLVDCRAAEVVVLVENNGEVDTMVDLALPRAAVAADLVVDGRDRSTTTLAIGDLEGAAEVRISDSETGEVYARSQVDIGCSRPGRPTVDTVLDCPAGVLVVRLGNDGGDPVTLRVIHEQVAEIATVEVGVGQGREVEIPLGDADEVPVRVVDGEGDDVLRVGIPNSCPAVAGGAGAPGAPEVVQTACDRVRIDAAEATAVSIMVDGLVLAEGPADPGDSVAVVPGRSSRVSATDPTSGRSSSVQTDGRACATVTVLVVTDCAADDMTVTIRRAGTGRERFVVLVDDQVAGVVAIEGSGESSVPAVLTASEVDVVVDRALSSEPIAVGTVSCPGGSGGTGPVAASMVALAVVASAAGIAPWPPRLRPV